MTNEAHSTAPMAPELISLAQWRWRHQLAPRFLDLTLTLLVGWCLWVLYAFADSPEPLDLLGPAGLPVLGGLAFLVGWWRRWPVAWVVGTLLLAAFTASAIAVLISAVSEQFRHLSVEGLLLLLLLSGWLALMWRDVVTPATWERFHVGNALFAIGVIAQILLLLWWCPYIWNNSVHR